jgi:hypothetical protein
MQSDALAHGVGTPKPKDIAGIFWRFDPAAVA